MKRIAICLSLAAVLGLSACGSDDPPKDTSSTVEDTGVDDAGPGDAGETDVENKEDAASADTNAAEDTSTADAAKSDVPDATSTTICTSDTYCESFYKGNIAAHQIAVCGVDGVCKKVTKAGFCANSGDCDDGSECTDDSCDLTTNKCVSSPKPNCCAGKVSLLNARFEQKTLEGFVGSASPKANNNVAWQLSSNRGHASKNSLYLGNECNSYNTSKSAASGCKAGASALAFEANLTSQEVVLPKNKPAIAHFWLWLDAQPKFKAATTCANPCPEGTTCVKIDGGTSVCAPEQDVLRVFVETGAPSPDPVWISTTINKSTQGWLHVAINLAPYQKKDKDTALKLRWNFKANNANNDHEGAYIDDVVIETLCVSAGGQCSKKTPCADDKNGCTTDSCTFFANDDSQGLCFADKTAGCCINAADCNDLNDCTVDQCTVPKDASEGTCTNAPDDKNPQCCQPKELFGDNFESGSTAAWNHVDSNSKSVKWQISDKDSAGSGGKKSLFFGQATLDGYDDPSLGSSKGPKGRLCSPNTLIEQGTLYDLLTFDVKMQTEWSGKPAANYKNPPCPQGTCQPNKIDHLAVEIYTAGQYFEVWSSDSVKGTTEGKWLPAFVNLDKYQGKTVKFCFGFDAGDGGANKTGGVWIDNVKLAVKCKDIECTSDTQSQKQCEEKCGACSTKSCSTDGQCLCTPIAGCCAKSADCADGDACTTDVCEKGQCKYALTSPTCCTDKTGDKSNFKQDWEASPLMPGDWKVQVPTGKNALGMTYAKDKAWRISIKSKPSTGNYSLYFGGKDGTLNAGTDVPAGTVTGPEFSVPKNGTTLINFDLFLNTEWDDFAFKKPPIAIDQLFVNVIDVAEKDPKKAVIKVWDSFAIEGSTKGKWVSTVMAIPANLAGKKVRLQFVFDCGTNANNKGEGAFIDNLKVETLCTKPACIADADCAPKVPDTCKKFWCGTDNKGVYACQSEFKAGQGCCQSSIALALESSEGGSLAKWVGKPSTGQVKWQVVSHKYLEGKKELYYGNSTAWNYAAGSAKVCTAAKDCPTNSGEQCTGAPGKKKCYKPVTSELISDPFDLSADINKLPTFDFKAYIDVETKWETLEIWVSYLDQVGGQPVPKQEKIWDKSIVKDMALTDFKKVIDKSLDLAKYKAKKNVRIKLVFDSGDANGNDKYEGIFLDQLVVKETCK
ncbi:MAG: hypothetical protein KC502_02930 [Myxococcales bacterium]|nr:hypothetical protein [Myxococcales bacterium]